MIVPSLNSLVTLIAVTGGPSAGKSTFLSRARNELEDRGFRTAIQPEVATEFIGGGFSPIEGWRDNLDFQIHLLNYMILRENLYSQMLAGQEADKPRVLLCDRGALDAIAYIGPESFYVVARELGHEVVELRNRYKLVIHLESAAVSAAKHYTLENNKARTEGLNLAQELDAKTRQAWMGHSHHSFVPGQESFDAKMVQAFNCMGRVLDMPKAMEKERKFIFKNSSDASLTNRYKPVQVEIVQTYLVNGPHGEERRVRLRTVSGESSYTFTEKVETAEVGVREEREETITKRRYEELLREADVEARVIKKVRLNIFFEGRKFEVDFFQEPEVPEVLVEVEVGDMKESIEFPPGWDLEDVTGLKKYGNYAIAHGSLGK